MTLEEYKQHNQTAHHHRRQGDGAAAADEYTLAAYEALGKSKLENSVDFSRAITALMNATLCYRLGSRLERAQIRAQQGILIAEELRDGLLSDYDRYQGVTWEYVGDFRVIGKLDDYDAAYQTAAELYIAAGDPPQYDCDDSFDPPINILDRTATAIRYDLAWDYNTARQSERIDVKRNHFPAVIDAVLAEGEWNYEDKE